MSSSLAKISSYSHSDDSSGSRYEDTNAETLSGTVNSSLPLRPTIPLRPIPPAQIPDQRLLMPQYPVSLRQSSPSIVPQMPPPWMYGHHIDVSSTMPHSEYHPFDCWSSRHVETFQGYLLDSLKEEATLVGASAALPPMNAQVAYQPPLEYPPHKTQTMVSGGRWTRLDYGLNGVFETSSNRVETSAPFRTASSAMDETLDSYQGSHFPITSFYPQSNITNHQGPHQLSSESPLTPASSISYFISPLPRTPATDVQYFLQDRRIKQVRTLDEDTYATDRKFPLTDIDDMGHVEWLHHNSELKWLALYQPADATSRLASNSANVPAGEWSSQFPPMIGGGKYVLERPCGHEMVRLWPCSCSLRPTRCSVREGVIMPARDGRNANIMIGYHIIKTSIQRFIYFVVLIGHHVLPAEIMDKYSHSTCNPASESAGLPHAEESYQ